MRIFSKENRVLGVVVCILLMPVLVNAKADPSTSLLDLVDRWAQNAAELDQMTKSLSAANALLKEENKRFDDSIKILAKRDQRLSKDLYGLSLQEKQLGVLRDQKKKEASSFLRKTAKISKKILVFQAEKEALSAQLASEIKQQNGISDKVVKLHQEIKILEQKSFAQQRHDDAMVDHFKDSQGVVEQFFDHQDHARRALSYLLGDFNNALLRFYERIADVSMQKRSLEIDLLKAQEECFLLEAQEKELSCRRAGLKAQSSRGLEERASSRIMLKEENKEIGRAPCRERV